MTARAFSLVIANDYDACRAARVLADTTSPAALEEAVAHLQPALFGDDDRVVVAATELLLQALASSSSRGRAA